MKDDTAVYKKIYRRPIWKSLLYFLYFAAFLSSPSLCAQSFKAPVITGTTLTGKKVDSLYFKNKLTLVSFFYIGCAPCMKEIPVLNKLQQHFRDSAFQILAVAPHTPLQLAMFNPEDTAAVHADVISRYKTEKIIYDILPECPEDANSGYAPRCYRISSLFGVSAYPTAVFINGKGEIVMTTEGFPMRENTEETFREMVKMVDGYLK